MNKKAQIAIFILIGIVILISASFILYLNQSYEEAIDESQETVLSSAPIKTYIESCLTEKVKEGINFISEHGGYYDLPLISTYTAYYIYYGVKELPSLEDMQNELDSYTIDNYSECLNFEMFEKQGFEIEYKDPTLTSSINDNSVSVKANIQIEIKKNEQTTSLNEFNINIESSLKKLYDTATEFVEEQMKDPEYVPRTFLVDLGIKNQVVFEIVEGEQTFIYNIIDTPPIVSEFPINETELKQNLVFSFAVKYDW